MHYNMSKFMGQSESISIWRKRVVYKNNWWKIIVIYTCSIDFICAKGAFNNNYSSLFNIMRQILYRAIRNPPYITYSLCNL